MLKKYKNNTLIENKITKHQIKRNKKAKMLENEGKYNEAISSLEKFKSENETLNTLAIGAIGDAYSQKNQPKEALDFYVKASQAAKNEFTTPRFLMKAGKTALALGNKADALKYFTEIKDVYDNTPEGQAVDAFIGLAQ